MGVPAGGTDGGGGSGGGATPNRIKPGNSTAAGEGVKTVGNGSGNELETNVINIINGVIAVLGLICVVVIILGGVQYMTSSGDSGKVKKAKDTILYGIIGLVICVLAFAIVNFIIVNIIG